MDNSGDWVNILIIVATLIAGLVSAKNKKNKDAKEAQKRVVKPVIPQRQERVVKPVTVTSAPQRHQYVPTPKPFLSDDESNVDHLKPINAINLDEAENIDISLNSAEDFRKAIIYSEIINRKY